MRESEFKQVFDRRESPEEAKQTVEDPEVAEEMAIAEIEPRERMAIAAELGLSDESIKELGLEADRMANEARETYDEARQEAERLLTQLLKNPDESIPIYPPFYKRNIVNAKALLNAINYRIHSCIKEGVAQPKVFTIGGIKKKIDYAIDPEKDVVIKFFDIDKEED